AGVEHERGRVAGFQVLSDDPRGESGEAHAGIQSARREGRGGARGIADEETAWPGDPPQDPADGDAPAAPLDGAPPGEIDEADEAFPEGPERRERVEARGIAAATDVDLLAVVRDPGEIAGGAYRIQEGVQARDVRTRAALEHLLDADDPLAVDVESQI